VSSLWRDCFPGNCAICYTPKCPFAVVLSYML